MLPPNKSLQGTFDPSPIFATAKTAAADAGLAVVDTDIGRIISPSRAPLLLFASSSDPVAPYAKFKRMRSVGITVKDLPNRNHPSMSVVGDASSQIIIDWLTEQTSKASG